VRVAVHFTCSRIMCCVVWCGVVWCGDVALASSIYSSVRSVGQQSEYIMSQQPVKQTGGVSS
jgi:hypothetical protein